VTSELPSEGEYYRRVAAMFADPHLTGDLLLVGLYLVDQWWNRGGDVRVEDVADALFPAAPPLTITFNGAPQRGRSPGVARVDKALRDDIRRYDPLWEGTPVARYRCQAPMLRRSGVCGGTDHRAVMVTDVATGKRSMLVACTRHNGWWEQQWAANRAAVAAAGVVPAPSANRGGVLARHFPEVDWPAYWARLDPRWVRAPEPDDEAPGGSPTLRLLTTSKPVRTARRRPELRLIAGDGEVDDGAAGA
jgi:hypothetical protein